MPTFEEKEYKIFELFKKQWPLVAAGNIDHYNACTIGWGEMGTLWKRPDKDGQVVTVYLHPARYTTEFLKNNDYFTVSFFSEEYKNSLTYMGTHSGRNENKALNAGLTPISINNSVGFKEAELTFVCRKIYGSQMNKDGICNEVKEYYKSRPQSFPPDENGEWQPHYMFIGEIVEVIEK